MPLLIKMVQQFAVKTFSEGMLRTLEDFTQKPDIVEEFFYLIERMLKCCPQGLLESGMLPTPVQAATVGMPVQQREASRALLDFFEF